MHPSKCPHSASLRFLLSLLKLLPELVIVRISLPLLCQLLDISIHQVSVIALLECLGRLLPIKLGCLRAHEASQVLILLRFIQSTSNEPIRLTILVATTIVTFASGVVSSCHVDVDLRHSELLFWQILQTWSITRLAVGHELPS